MLLEAKNITKKYANHTALNNVSIEVEKGTVFGLLGPNGAGKTSLIRIINQITAPDEGEVRFIGQPIPPAGTPAWRVQRARMQMIYQDPLGALDRRLPVITQVKEPLDIHQIGEALNRPLRAH
jgi:peptide/nickel transport system ATP-binding protein